MELKAYQQGVLGDLAEYIQTLKEQSNLSKAFSSFWRARGIESLQPGEPIFHPYCDTQSGVPCVTVKVPTAGGKTFIACNALRTIFDAMSEGRMKVVAWFVPSDTILRQTYQNLNNPQHPYRQRIDALFGGRVEVYDKQALLFGQNFNPTLLRDQLSIMVLSIQSFASNAKDKRLVYSEDEYLTDFAKTYHPHEKRIEGVEETSLIQVIAHLNPVVIIDESHNFEGNLRTDTIASINPCFVLNLTATPREKSNVISIVSSASLKRESMVKLPVMVSNYQKCHEVIKSAITLRKNLEDKAREEEAKGGDYIRPIVLFQAQPKNDEDSITFANIKNVLVKDGIPEEEIKIKTASINELKNIDLMSRDCPVRYILTVNALKEGWDCPFAYVLASVANRSSQIDVEQVLGRILRQPYTRQHGDALLNMSYVLTSSADFQATIDNVVTGLQQAGYSGRDYVARDTAEQQKNTTEGTLAFPKEYVPSENNQSTPAEEPEWDWTPSAEDIIVPSGDAQGDLPMANSVNDLLQDARKMSKNYEQQLEKSNHPKVSGEVMSHTRIYAMQEDYRPYLGGIRLPQFYLNKQMQGGFFDNSVGQVLLSQEELLQDFKLFKMDRNVSFTNDTSNIRKLDVGKDGDGITIFSVRAQEALKLENFYGNISDKHTLVTMLCRSVMDRLSPDNSVSDRDLYSYIRDVLAEQDVAQLRSLGQNLSSTVESFKQKIKALKVSCAKKQFEYRVNTKQIVMRPSYLLPTEQILTKEKAPALDKKMYQEEEGFNGFERKVIEQVISLDCVRCWHRNQERGRGFCINGYVNAYPDFIVVLNNGVVVLVETKGNHLNGSDSHHKVAIGKKWADLAGGKFAYFMVFEGQPIEDAVSVPEFIDGIVTLGSGL